MDDLAISFSNLTLKNSICVVIISFRYEKSVVTDVAYSSLERGVSTPVEFKLCSQQTSDRDLWSDIVHDLRRFISLTCPPFIFVYGSNDFTLARSIFKNEQDVQQKIRDIKALGGQRLARTGGLAVNDYCWMRVDSCCSALKKLQGIEKWLKENFPMIR